MKKILTMLAAAATFCGCMNIEYTGRKFTPVESVKYCTPEDVDMDTNILIGRFTVTSRTAVHPYEVEDAVLEKAEAYGGDILCLTGSEIIAHGEYTPNSREFGKPIISERNIPEAEKENFGKISPLSSNTSFAQRKVFHYLLYKNRDEVNRQLGR